MPQESNNMEFLTPVAEYFKVLSEISRLQIVICLKSGTKNVSEIGAATGLGQANLSKHLKLLTQAGILARKPQGVSVYYEVSDPLTFELCELVCDRIYQRMQEQAKQFKKMNSFSTN
ncbi:helix-turn-helix transcriptional regulator [Waterburya agarophytonicola K14]|uniref:Helix-turn-helix transcriptional regulator n=1 Tax=Waterburya agarophytonicola KI4 TaxID=2874699 RepID=A0A964FFP4_9CYAN|nr:metalloregulator ArsR/SmtB family transcription factor [Waterburya agarophytonicola]MCC0177176.1 helix-turn-helix transcriptional regulator [Waterburya agarophytonicola KI4]